MPNIIEETAAKAAGKVGAIRAAFNGLDGVFRQLADEHKQVATLLASATMASTPEKRADLWGKIRQELTAHEHAERQVVYPEFEMHASLMKVVSEHEAEADELELLIRNVDTCALSSSEWEAHLKLLQKAVVHHATREEKEFFPQAQEVLGEQRVEELEKRYLSARRVLLEGL
jgi:hemerythrin superfamily protein